MIVVNPATRQFNIPGADLVFGVTADANSAIKHFQCPRYVGNNVDIASSFVRINYQNHNGEIDFYLVKEVTVDGDNVLFDWKLHPKVTMYKGNVSFVMCVTGPDAKVKWHTTLGRGQVLEGLEPDNALVETQTEDGIAALLAMVEAQTAAVEDKGAEWVRNVQNTGTDQIIGVQTAARNAQTTAVAEIEAKGVNTRNGIPTDYTALSETVDSLVRGRAGAIVCETEGSAIAVKDASNMAIQGLRIFGRSTQDGAPTPDAPVEIKSVESPVETVCGKNLLNIDAGLNANFVKENDVYTLTRNEDASRFSHVIPLNIPANTRVMFSFELVEHTKSSNNLPFYYIGESGEDYYLSTNAVATSVYTEAITGIRFYLQSSEEIGAYIRFKNVQIEVGSERTDYEPHKTAQTIETANPLRGIPVTTGGNYTDKNGQQWICDEVDLERGVYVQRCYLDTLKFDYQAELERYTAVLKYSANTASIVGNGIPVLCDKYPFHDLAGSGTPKFNGIRIAAASPTRAIAYYNGEEISTATVLYPIATPIETPLSETEIAAYRALHTNKPNTTILNDSGAHMKVEYAADTKLYIDNKLAALVGNT